MDRSRQDGLFVGDTGTLRILRDFIWHQIASYGFIMIYNFLYTAPPNPFQPFLSRQTDNVIVFDDLLAMHHG